MTSFLQPLRRSFISEPGARLLMTPARVTAIMILAIAPACFRPHFDHVMCNSEGKCPDGLTCVNDVCERNDPPDGPMLPVDDSVLPQPPSCVGLGATCGANRDDSCCNSPLVTGGMYYRTYDVASDTAYKNMNFPATIGDFRLDKYEVTVGRFREFVNAGMGTQATPPSSGTGEHPPIPGSGWNPSWNTALKPDKTALLQALNNDCVSQYRTWTDMSGPNDNRPMTCITWFEAMAFCIWDGGYLPTEAEWNYAASGGSDHRAYPWSSPFGDVTTLDKFHASFKDIENHCTGDEVDTCTLADLIEVGTKPPGAGRWGQLDLTGNVWEWTLDKYVDPYATSVCVNCANLATDVTSNRAFRGSSFLNGNIEPLRAAERGSAPPGRALDVGVRCARAPSRMLE